MQYQHPTERAGAKPFAKPPGGRTIGLVACSKAKLSVGAPAAELYQGELFKKARAYVERECDDWLILSGLWHVLQPTDFVEPYELYLPGAGAEWRKCWANAVVGQLEQLLDPSDRIVCLASAPYRTWAAGSVWEVSEPLAGLGLGEQLGWLKDAA
jgi:hypothetical protein